MNRGPLSDMIRGRAGDVDVSNIDVSVLRRGEWLNKTFAFARLLATWTQHIGLKHEVVDSFRDCRRQSFCNRQTPAHFPARETTIGGTCDDLLKPYRNSKIQ
jgi:hypothetical protein